MAPISIRKKVALFGQEFQKERGQHRNLQQFMFARMGDVELKYITEKKRYVGKDETKNVKARSA